MTMEQYRASHARAAKMIELMQTNPEEGRRQTAKSFEPMGDRVNKWYAKHPQVKRTTK